MRELRSLEYVVVDVETTGGSAAKGDRVTEFAAVCVDGRGQVLEEFGELVNPERSIPPFVARLTNITDSMVRDAPLFAEIAPEVQRLLEGRIFVAHNAIFDWRFVRHEMERAVGEVHEGPRLCTVRLARRLVPEVRSRSLDSLSEFFDIRNEARHRALGDARATVELLGHLLERAAAHELESWEALEAFLKGGTPRPRRRGTPSSAEYP